MFECMNASLARARFEFLNKHFGIAASLGSLDPCLDVCHSLGGGKEVKESSGVIFGI